MNYKDDSSTDEEELDFNSVESSFNLSSEEASIESEKNKYRTRSLVAEVTDRLHKLTTAGAVLEEEVVEGLVVGEAESHQAKADNASDREIMAAAFEVENGVDGENALEKGCRALEKLEWSYDNIPFFFNRCETRMAMHGVKKQYTEFDTGVQAPNL